MIGVDTNILVRYLVQDDPKQSLQASEWLDSMRHKREFIFINQVVFCELVWVLEGPYQIDKKTLILTLEKILLAKQFEIESKDEIRQALSEFKRQAVDFADALIGVKNRMAGCRTTLTFDQKAAKKLEAFTVLAKLD